MHFLFEKLNKSILLKFEIFIMRIITIKYYLLKIFCSLIFTVIITGCYQTNNKDALDEAAVHFSGIFITQYVTAIPSLRVKGQSVVVSTGDSSFHVKGSLEGFTSFNVPVSIKHFSESLYYSGDNPNNAKNWKCIDIYIDDKKMR